MAQINLILPICEGAMIQSLSIWFCANSSSSQKNILFGALNGYIWEETNAAHNLEFPNFWELDFPGSIQHFHLEVLNI